MLLEQPETGKTDGRFDAVVLFVDTSGFTPLTARLSEHGRDGAEVLAEILLAVFEPLIEAIYAHGGFIAGFAGDAFKAVFPEMTSESYLHALAAADQIRTHMVNHPSHETRYGTFDFRVRVSLAAGEVTWAIWSGDDDRAAQSSGYTFAGSALDQAIQGEDHAAGGEVVATDRFLAALQSIQPELVSYTPLTGAAAGYVRIDRVVEELPASVPTVSREASLSAAGRFYPAALLTMQAQGEFRPVYSVFLNVQRLPEPGSADDYLPVLLQLLDQYGGYLCRIGQIGAGDPGGTFLLFWGAPTSHENDLHRVLSFLPALRNRINVAMRAGVTHAVVYAGFVGSHRREEYTCHGSSVNQAARQMGVAAWGQILLDEQLALRAQDAFSVTLAGEYGLKGLVGRQPLFALQGQRTEREISSVGRSTARASEALFVGRSDEMAQLHAAVAPIFEGRFAGFTLISGDAGIGKSRLVQEALSAYADEDAAQPLHVFLCQTDEILRESLNPLRYFLQRYFELAPGNEEAVNRAKFTAKLDALIADTVDSTLAGELERTRSFLGVLVNVHLSDSLYEQLEPQLRFENTLTALKTLILAESLRQPVLLLIEDTHWLDEDSLFFLGSLIRNVDAYPFAIVATARPQDEAESILSEIVQHEIVLSALTADDIATVARAKLGAPASADLTELLMMRAEGNPFFAEQMLLYLQERNLLTADDQQWSLSQELAADAMLPNDIEAILVARLDQLTQMVREVVQTAAVLGREFDVQVLSAVLRNERPAIDNIREAEEAAIWSAISELRYLFKHALLRDAAYQMQLRSQRRELHALAATTIERLYANDLAPHYVDLVYHFNNAAMPEREVHYATVAGRQADAQFANSTAIRYFSRALELTPANQIAERYTLLIAREAVYGRLGDRERQGEDIAALHALANDLADAAQITKIWLRDCEYGEAIGDYPRALAAAAEATTIAEAADPVLDEVVVDAMVFRGNVLILQGEHDEAMRELTQAIDLTQQYNLPRQRALALQHLAQLHSRLGQYQEGKAAGLRALEEVQAIDEWARTGFGLNNVGICCLFLGEYDEAKEYFEQSLLMKKETGDRRGEGASVQNVGIVAYYEGILDVAMHHFEEALRLRRETGERASEGDMCSNLGVLYQSLGDYETALTYFEEAEQLHREMGYQHGIAMVLRNYSLLYYHLGEWEHARRYAEEALEQSRTLDVVPDQASTLTNLGHILAAQGKWVAAQDAFTEAVDLRRQSKQEHLAIEAMVGLLNLPNVDGAQQRAWLEEVWQFLDTTGTDGMLEPYRIYWDCYRALTAREDSRAQPLLQHAYEQLQRQAAKFVDPTLRHSFLNNVAANQAIVRAYQLIG